MVFQDKEAVVAYSDTSFALVVELRFTTGHSTDAVKDYSYFDEISADSIELETL